MTDDFDPDEVLESASQEWIDRVSQGITNEIISYFEGRFTALEEQVITGRRFIVRNEFQGYVSGVIATLNQHLGQIQAEQNWTPQDQVAAIQRTADCYSFVATRTLQIADAIVRSRNPERYFHSVQIDWKNYFAQRGIPLGETLPAEDQSPPGV